MASKHDQLLNQLRDDLNGVASVKLEVEDANRIIFRLWNNSGQNERACREVIHSLGWEKPSSKIRNFKSYGLKFLNKLSPQEEQVEIISASDGSFPTSISGDTQNAETRDQSAKENDSQTNNKTEVHLNSEKNTVLLSKLEVHFLARHGLTESDVHDGRSQRRKDFKEAAKANGKSIVLGRPCKKAGHRLKTRAGHCIQCNSSKLEYERRHAATGYIYVAFSKRSGLVKVGCATNVKGRSESLIDTKYGGYDDWKIVFSDKTKQMGRVETTIQRLLRENKATGFNYEKNGVQQEATEVFDAPLEKVLATVEKVLGLQNYR